jgi:hypothetical protein
MFDAVNQSYRTSIMGPSGDDFTITQGMGVFIYAFEAGVWQGEG